MAGRCRMVVSVPLTVIVTVQQRTDSHSLDVNIPLMAFIGCYQAFILSIASSTFEYTHSF